MPTGRILKIKLGHDANCSSGAVALFVFLLYGAAWLGTISFGYYLAWRIGKRYLTPLKLLLVVVPGVPFVLVGVYVLIMSITTPGYWESFANSVGLRDPVPALVTAAKKNDLEKVRALLTAGNNVNVEDPRGLTALQIATRSGSVEMVRLLVEKGANLNGRDYEDEESVLFQPARSGRLEVVRALVDGGADVNVANRHGATVIFGAARQARSDVVRLVLERGADLKPADKNGQTALIEACGRADDYGTEPPDTEVADRGSESGNRDGVSIYKRTKDRADVVRLLVEHGADVNAEDTCRWTPLTRASQNGYPDVVRLLLDSGANVDARVECNGTTALMQASGQGFMNTVRILLDRGARVDTEPDRDGLTALGGAAIGKHRSVVDLLKSAGGKDYGPACRPFDLIEAIRRNDLTEVEKLLQQGVNVNSSIPGSESALWEAMSQGFLEGVRLLLKYGADVNVSRLNGHTVLMGACNCGRADVVRILLEHGADPNMRTSRGETALSIASETGNREIVAILKAKGAK